MNELMNFDYKGSPVRTIELNGEPWFVGKDVASILGYSDTSDALKKHVDKEDKLTRQFTDSGQARLMYVINESGLYSLILSSKLPKAKTFKRWVTSEVIPSIRKSGKYAAHERIPGPSMYDKTVLLETTARMLNLNDAGKILMLRKFSIQEGIKPDFLPEYENNGGRQLIAASTLLKKFNLDASIIKFNQSMEEKGFLETKERPSTKGDKVKRFKSLTEKGAQYGENVISPQNPREVQPLYYEDSFMELYGLVMDQKKEVK